MDSFKADNHIDFIYLLLGFNPQVFILYESLPWLLTEHFLPLNFDILENIKTLVVLENLVQGLHVINVIYFVGIWVYIISPNLLRLLKLIMVMNDVVDHLTNTSLLNQF